MSDPNVTIRKRKGRLLLVGLSNGQQDIGAQLDPPALRADNIFQAIGEITAAPANAPVSKVIIATHALPEPGSNALEAIRRTDPSLSLYLLLDPEAIRAEFDGAQDLCDAILEGPLEISQLQRLLDEDAEPQPRIEISPTLIKKDKPPSPLRTEQESHHEDESAQPMIEVEAPSIRGEEIAHEIGEPLPEDSGDEIFAPEPAIETPSIEIPTPPTSPTHETLGDIDLIEAAMSSPHGVLESALQLMRQQTGWSDVRFDETPPPQDIASGEVVSRQQRFGYLISEQASPDELRNWGGWLAKWLLLDHHYRRYRRLAYQDELTGAFNRRYFFKFLNSAIRRATQIRRPLSVLVFDIDNFKKYNDAYGHKAGDVILTETVRLLQSEIRDCDRVCRIGGDEFAVIFADLEGPREVGSTHPATVEKIARRFQLQICQMKFPKLGIDAPGTLSISGGLASYPWDSTDARGLLHHADQLSLMSKRKGKNALTFGPGAEGVCPPPDAPESCDHAP